MIVRLAERLVLRILLGDPIQSSISPGAVSPGVDRHGEGVGTNSPDIRPKETNGSWY